MIDVLDLFGAVSVGLIIGYVFGIVTKRFLTPRASELRKALEENQDHYKSQLGRMRARLKEYEQPSELQGFANKYQGSDPKDIVGLLSNELANVRGLPRWVRPFLPAIQGYIKENPDQVQALIGKFLTPHKDSDKELSMQDSL